MPKEEAKSHDNNAFQLLQYCQLGTCRKQVAVYAARVRKRRYSVEQPANVAFGNLLNLFKHKHAASAEKYNAEPLVVTDSFRKAYPADVKAEEPPSFDDSSMSDVLSALQAFCTASSPLALSPKILNAKLKRGQQCCCSTLRSVLV